MEVPALRFPGSCRRFGCRRWLLGSSCARWGVAPSSRLAYRTPRCIRTPSGLSCCACTSCDRAGRPLDPGDGGALPAGDYPPAGTRRSAAASPYGPAGTSHRRGSPSRGVIRGSLMFAHHPRRLAAARGREASSLPTGLLLACGPRMEQEPLGLLPRASHPAVTRDARRGGDRPSRTGPGTTPPASAEPPSVPPTCTHAPSRRT
jgi:hypothetical protein